MVLMDYCTSFSGDRMLSTETLLAYGVRFRKRFMLFPGARYYVFKYFPDDRY